MHEHELLDAEQLRTRPAKREDAGDALAMRAAQAGRLDALNPRAVLGLQRAMGNGGAAAVLSPTDEREERSPVHDVISSSGAPLQTDLRADMESRLGHDFSDVRVHTDGAADSSAKAVNAHAYTVGSHIAFQRSAYDPDSTAGRTTLAHELTHVVQQRNGPVDGTPAAGGVSISDPSDRFEREAVATADTAMSGPAPVAAAPAGAVQRLAVQREGEEMEEEPVQGSFVQRDAVQREGEEMEEEPAT